MRWISSSFGIRLVLIAQFWSSSTEYVRMFRPSEVTRSWWLRSSWSALALDSVNLTINWLKYSRCSHQVDRRLALTSWTRWLDSRRWSSDREVEHRWSHTSKIRSYQHPVNCLISLSGKKWSCLQERIDHGRVLRIKTFEFRSMMDNFLSRNV